MRQLLLSLFVAFACCDPTYAQSCGSVVYNSDDGLGATNYMGVFQDSKGMLWIGSYGSGVSRFNGKRWESWTTSSGILSNLVSAIFEDPEGGMWFSHNDQGASRWKDGVWEKFEFTTGSVAVGQLLYDLEQKRVLIIESGWYNRASTRIFAYDYKSRGFVLSGKTVLPESLAGLYQTFEFLRGKSENEWWVNAVNIKKRSSDYYHVQDGNVREMPALPVSFEENPRPVYTNAALSAQAGEAIMEHDHGIIILKNQHWQNLPAPSIPRYSNFDKSPPLKFAGSFFDSGTNSLFAAWNILESGDQNRYLLAEYDATTLLLRRTILFSNPFWGNLGYRQIRKDVAGTLWIATTGNVLRLFPDKFYIPVTAPGMPSQPWAIAQAGNGQIWFASNDHGLVNFDGLNVKPGPPDLSIIQKYNDGSLTDRAGNIYFNSTQIKTGILKFDGNNQWESLVQDCGVQGFFLSRDKKGRIIWGTSKYGLWILPLGKPGKDSSDWIKINGEKGLQLENVLTALEDRYGRYWMGRLSQGIATYDPNSQKVTNWLRNQSANNYGCMSMAEDSRGNLWFGTDRGLCFFENRADIPPDFNLSKQLLRVGLDFTGQSTVTSCLAYDTHTLVIGNSAGFHLLDLDAFYATERQVLIRSFGLKDGYQAGPVGQNALFVDRDSCLWMTTANGTFRYDPQALTQDRRLPEVMVDKIIAGRDTLFDFSHRLELSSDQRYIEIFFRAPMNPMLYDNLRFEYRLKGDSNWVKILSEASSVTFPSLNAGTYHFEIRAVKDGLFSKQVVIEFRISPTLWEQPMFWILILTTVVGIGAFWWRREVKIANQRLQISNQKFQIEKSINEMAQMSKEKDKLQVQAIVNQLNPHFINNALQWLQVRVDEDEEAVRVVGKLSENISTVFKNSRIKKSFHSMREEMKLAENYLYIQKCRFRDKLSYQMPDEAILARLENMDVPLMIVQIHAENAVEHGIRCKSTGVGRVNISLREDEHYAIITIEDDGVGRAIAQKIGTKGTQNGTKMLKELETIYNKQNALPLTQEYEDNIFVDASGKGYGTRVIVRMPKDYNFEF